MVSLCCPPNGNLFPRKHPTKKFCPLLPILLLLLGRRIRSYMQMTILQQLFGPLQGICQYRLPNFRFILDFLPMDTAHRQLHVLLCGT